ncbi:MAG: VacJ family lipoprotein [Gammaproteobacteria bacterium]|nr:VacJ family lipoprotein [Gammaproteobacteria bacterium]
MSRLIFSHCIILTKAVIATVIITGCASNNDSVLESYNKGMYKINRTVDKYTLKPLAKAYRFVTPDPVEKSVNNFFNNIGEVNTIANSLLQGKFRNAALSSSRMVWNTTIGIGGLFDVATAFNISADKEDFGQTLQVWGLPTGPYVVLPFWGPSTITDSVGLGVDTYLSPINRYNNWADHSVREGVVVLNIVNTRAQLLDLEKVLETGTTDEYYFVKNAYLQKRAVMVNDGEVVNEEMDKELDDLFGD